jgi:geranylgeranylglycerol-phosphate geranylgeranyltransferase
LAALVLTVFFIASGTMPLNDIIDEHADRINAPHRPLPSGQLSRKQAVAIHIIHSALGLIFAASSGLPGFAFSVLIYLNATAYSFLKGRLLFIPNLQVSISVAAVFLGYGIFSMQSTGELVTVLSSGLLPFIVPVAFLTSLQLEIAGDILDEEGDRKNGDSSLPIKLGLPAARGIFAAIGTLHLGLLSYLLLSARPGSGLPALLFAADALLTGSFTLGFFIISKNPSAAKKAGLKMIFAYFICMTLLMVAGGLLYRHTPVDANLIRVPEIELYLYSV